MNAPSAVRNIMLDKLVLSPTNVRKTPPSAAEDAELKASIRSRGLKQNLVAHPSAETRGIYEVTAGGRRLKALQELAAEGALAADFRVPCLVEEAAAALETSLMENTIRAAMHPADEFVAMAALIDGGLTIDEVAIRFGTSERHVRQRLRLGKLAPELLDAYRNGDIGLETVTAFTLGADHQAQLAVWRQVKDNSYIQPYTVKRLLTESAVPLDSALGHFVGAEAYEAAGGHITRDLFSGDEDGFLDDPALGAASRSRSSKPGPPNCAPPGPGPGRCSIPSTGSWRSTPACIPSRPRSPPRSPPKSSASSSASASSRKSARRNGPTS